MFRPCPFCRQRNNSGRQYSAVELQTLITPGVGRRGHVVVYRVRVVKSAGNDQRVVITHKLPCWQSNVRFERWQAHILPHVDVMDAWVSKLLTHVPVLVTVPVRTLSPVALAKRADRQHHHHYAQSDAEDDGDGLLQTAKPRCCEHRRKQTGQNDYVLIFVRVLVQCLLIAGAWRTSHFPAMKLWPKLIPQ